MIFDDVSSFRKALYEYSIEWGFELIRDKNEKVRMTAHYGYEGCEWMVHASPMPDGSFKVKTCVPNHTCVRNERIRALAQ